jgi:hypothetical protein
MLPTKKTWQKGESIIFRGHIFPPYHQEREREREERERERERREREREKVCALEVSNKSLNSSF